jgi:hypothetical protein
VAGVTGVTPTFLVELGVDVNSAFHHSVTMPPNQHIV